MCIYNRQRQRQRGGKYVVSWKGEKLGTGKTYKRPRGGGRNREGLGIGFPTDSSCLSFHYTTKTPTSNVWTRRGREEGEVSLYIEA